jgi:hypothetical protein
MLTSSWVAEPCEGSPYPTAPHNLQTVDSGVLHPVDKAGTVRDVVVQYVFCRWCHRSGTRGHEMPNAEGPR